ncbi:MAG: hypothetical protein IMW99_07390 [Firmicutes bacterium]|nr:hypothetical protein [Bacillota bacterium]
MADLYAELQQAKIKLISAYDRLREAGVITPEQYQSICDLMDNLDEMSAEEATARLQEWVAELQRPGGVDRSDGRR